MDVPCPRVPPLPLFPSRNSFQSSGEEKGATRSRGLGGKRNACNEEGRKESFGSGACGWRGKNVERRKTDGGGGGGCRGGGEDVGGERRGGGCSWRFMTGVKQ